MSYLYEHERFEPSPDCMDANKPTTQSDVRPWVTGVILGITSCFIISTNLLVAAALLKLPLKKRSHSWCFVLNLALTDALVGVAITCLAAEDFISNISRNQHIHITAVPCTNATPPAQGRTQCFMQMAFVASPCTASIASTFLISLYRYAAIKRPLQYSQLSGKGKAVVSLLALWIISLTMGFMPVMMQQWQTDSCDDSCGFFSYIHQLCMIMLFSVLFFPVLSVSIYIYLDIQRIACSHQMQICHVMQASPRTADCHQQHEQLRSCSWSHAQEWKLIAVLNCYILVLWCPCLVVFMVPLLCGSCEIIVMLENYLWLLGLSNALINPLVYACWQREVWLQLAAMFSCFTGRSLAAGPPGVAEINDPPNVLTQAGGDTLNPSLLRPIKHKDKAQTGSVS